MIDADAAVAFLDFVRERHQVWEKRQLGLPQPWTEDRILATRKFTNVFRLLDPGSQFLITDLLDDTEDRDILMRCFLYRHTNLPSAWKAFNSVEAYPLHQELDLLREFWKDYRSEGGQVFSGAYMIYPQSSTPGTDKVDSIIDLTKRLFTPGSPDDIVPDFLASRTQRERFEVLRRNKGVADFMSMQILTDWGYSTEFREDEFVVPGPGARKGAAVIDPSAKAEHIIGWASGAIYRMEHVPTITTPNGRQHPPSVMDVQNCLCEFSKYARFASKPSPEKLYSPAHPGVQSEPVLPRHW